MVLGVDANVDDADHDVRSGVRGREEPTATGRSPEAEERRRQGGVQPTQPVGDNGEHGRQGREVVGLEPSQPVAACA